MRLFVIYIVLLFTASAGTIAQTAWQADGVPVCTAGGDQMNPVIVPDMKGGGIVIWQDDRSGNLDLYAQRIDSAGNRLWANNGVALASSAEMENEPKAISDMRGGAIMVFNKGSYNIWMQRVDSAGNPCWGVNGKAMCDNDSLQMSYRLCSDSAGGAIIIWSNADTFATGLADWDAYAQRVDSTGSLLWGASGIVVANGSNDQQASGIVEDGQGGGIIFWRYDYPGLDYRFYAERLDANGNSLWPLPSPICTTSGEKYFWDVTTDGRGGGIAVWKDKRSGNWDIYAQRVDSSGNARWQLNGVPVCTVAYSQEEPVIVSDGNGGGIIIWQDYRTGPITRTDIYAQRIDGGGNPLWTQNGLGLCIYDSTQGYPGAASDGHGGAIVTWFDGRTGYTDIRNIFGQWVDSSGSCRWGSDGLAVCTAAGLQWNDIYNRQNQMIPDGQGGAIAVWHDYRNGGQADIYAHRMRGHTGVMGEPTPASEIKPALRAWPNPFRSYAFVSGNKPGGTLRVYDVTGRLVEKSDGSIIGKRLPAGIYFITAEENETIKAIKLK